MHSSEVELVTGSTDNTLDLHQLKHLVRAAYKLDIRQSTGFQDSFSSKRMPPFVGALIFYTFVSIALAVGMYVIGSVFTAAIIAVTTVMVFIAMNIMVEFGGVILSPLDFDIIMPLPVSSRTFYYSKIVNLLLYTAAITASLGTIPTIALVVRTGDPLHVILFPLLLLMSSVCISLLMAGVYTTLLNYVSRERLSSVLGYVQMFLGFAFYFGYFVIPRIFGESFVAMKEFTEWWVFLLPPVWFASILGISGDVSTNYWIWSSVIGLAALAVVYAYGTRYLSEKYAAALSRSQSSSDRKIEDTETKTYKRGFLDRFLRNEEVGIYRLILAQFKYDTKFKMSVLSIVPITVLYLFIGLSGDGGGLTNPFIDGGGGDNILPFIAPGVLMILLASVFYSPNYQASWVFFATPADLRTIIHTTVKVLKYVFLIPYMLLLAGLLWYVYANIIHAVLMVTIVYLIAVVMMKVMYPFFAQVPFALPAEKGKRTISIIALVFILPLYFIPIVVFDKIMEEGPKLTVYIVTLLILLVCDGLASLFFRKKLDSRIKKMRYQG